MTETVRKGVMRVKDVDAVSGCKFTMLKTQKIAELVSVEFTLTSQSHAIQLTLEVNVLENAQRIFKVLVAPKVNDDSFHGEEEGVRSEVP